jgi:hypothetical protein
VSRSAYPVTRFVTVTNDILGEPLTSADINLFGEKKSLSMS